MTMAENDVPEFVFHYTDQNGLLGIIRSRQLWCTHAAYMNDASEYEFGSLLIREMLDRLQAGSRDARLKEYAQALTRQADYMRDAQAQTQTQEHAMLPWGPYVASFSADPDDLSQWRAYSKTGSRYQLAFRTCELRKIKGARFKKVEYCHDRSLKLLEDAFIAGVTAIDDSVPNGRGLPVSSMNPADYFTLPQQLADDIGIYCKHEKFSGEAEWRLVPSQDYTLDFRASTSFVIPYAFVDLRGLDRPIASITVGPCAHPDLSVLSVRQLLIEKRWQSAHVENWITVHKSKVPYRDW
jgi:hypothetical protein